MKILQLVQGSQLRGAEMFASQLGNQLLDAGHEVQLIILHAGKATLPFRGKQITLDRPIARRFLDVKGWRSFAELVKEFDPDVIQANAGDTLKFAVLSKLFFSWDTPIVYRNANKVSDFIDSWPKRVFNQLLLSKVSYVISVSELCRQDFIKTYRYDPGRTTTVPIGVEMLPINGSLPPDLISMFASAKILVHVASFVPEKNHLGLLRIMKTLIAQEERVKVILVGDGNLRAAIEQQISEMNLQEHVYLVGYRRDVLSIVSNASALILPSKIEGLPGVILEAMYCGVPVVAYDVGGISEVIREGETGWLVKAGDDLAFVAAVQNVLHTDTTIIRRNAHDQVVKKFDNKIIAKLFLEAYGKLLEKMA